jgi:hypothetical protein
MYAFLAYFPYFGKSERWVMRSPCCLCLYVPCIVKLKLIFVYTVFLCNTLYYILFLCYLHPLHVSTFIRGHLQVDIFKSVLVTLV